MPDLQFAWSPRRLLTGRTVRLPLRATDPEALRLDLDGFVEVGRRWSERDATLYLYIRAPETPGTRRPTARGGTDEAAVDIAVEDLASLRRPTTYNGADWPRRWPTGAGWTSRKTRPTLDDVELPAPDAALLTFWRDADDSLAWRQLPPAEWPRSHFVNCHEGCPRCGTAIFRHGGFYPWERSHRPADFRSTCPSCGLVAPDNDLLAGDYAGTAGALVDDGFGYVDDAGALYLFAATYCRDQTRAFGAGIGALAAHVRAAGGAGGDPEAARRLALLLLRYAAEEVYVAAAPQFRYGPTLNTERLFEWTTTGQTDWGAAPEPIAALYRMGTQRYCIDTPYISETLAVAYDTVFPLLREDDEIVRRAAACGLSLEGPGAAVQLVEEMLACLLQTHLDGAAHSNLPRVSEGALVLLRALQRDDGDDVLRWLYDDGPDALRVFTTNDFFPDGTPPEATGGYNNIHANGLFALEHHLRALKTDHPGAYPDEDFGSLLADPRAVRVVHAAHDIALLGRAYVEFGDGGSPAAQRRLGEDAYHAPLHPATLERAARLSGDADVARLRDDVAARRHRARGHTLLDGVGIAVLRTGEAPERAAAAVVYGDATGHRHADLLDVQLWARNRPFLSDLGYPQSWASLRDWEGHWSTHNTVWATVPGVHAPWAGRGRCLQLLETDGVRLLEFAAERWTTDDEGFWFRPGVDERRLVALVDTGGDGVALIDLARVRGGDEHWRTCRGLEGELTCEEATVRRGDGTVADPRGRRGDTTRLQHPDHAGLAWMDDVADWARADGVCCRWESAGDDDALDLHVLHVSDGARLQSARATATMGEPEASAYTFRPLIWRRRPRELDDVSCFDLVFEPHGGGPALRQATAIAGDRSGAGGVDLRTEDGRRLRLWWSPFAGPEAETRFADGTRLRGPLGWSRDGELHLVGGADLRTGDGRLLRGAVPQRGRIVDLDRDGCRIDVEGVRDLEAGARVVVNPDGRGRSYRVEQVTPLEGARLRLQLDVTSLLGRSRVRSVDAETVVCREHLSARTGYLHGARLQAGDGGSAVIDGARNTEGAGRTELRLESALAIAPGAWVSVVDYVVGDEILWVPAVSG